MSRCESREVRRGAAGPQSEMISAMVRSADHRGPPFIRKPDLSLHKPCPLHRTVAKPYNTSRPAMQPFLSGKICRRESLAAGKYSGLRAQVWRVFLAASWLSTPPVMQSYQWLMSVYAIPHSFPYVFPLSRPQKRRQIGRMEAELGLRRTSPPIAGPKQGRSRITNGTRFLHDVDGRSPWVRRCKDIIAAHLSDLGGADNASAAERSIIRRASVLTVELERLEAQFAVAGEADLRRWTYTPALPATCVVCLKRWACSDARVT